MHGHEAQMLTCDRTHTSSWGGDANPSRATRVAVYAAHLRDVLLHDRLYAGRPALLASRDRPRVHADRRRGRARRGNRFARAVPWCWRGRPTCSGRPAHCSPASHPCGCATRSGLPQPAAVSRLLSATAHRRRSSPRPQHVLPRGCVPVGARDRERRVPPRARTCRPASTTPGPRPRTWRRRRSARR